MNFDFADILLKVVEHKASDLHITAGAPPTIRVRGSLVPLEGQPNLTPTDTREIVYAILSSSQRQVLETDWQLDFAYSVPGVGRFRVNTFFQRGTLGAAFRLIPSETVPIEQLGLPSVVRQFASKPRGIVLVTGPTGSGKSTSLASLIDEINETRDDHILTIEDPIEFLHKHKRCLVNQREVGADAPSFAAGLKAALRQDPDVILVGEMRDMETIGTALTAAETGHLVLRHAAHPGRAADRRPHHRRLPARPAGPDPLPARDRPAGHRHADAAADRRRPGPLRRRRGAGADPGRAQSDPRGQDAPDLLADPDRWGAGHADDGLLARRPRPRGHDHDGDGRDALLATGRDAPPGPRHRHEQHGRGLMGAAVWTYKAVDGSGVPSKGQLKGPSKDAVAEQLQGQGLKIMELAEKKSALQADITLFSA